MRMLRTVVVGACLLVAACHGGEPRAPRNNETSSNVQTGMASWYGNELAGHKTANGERFDPSKLTAAHRTLRFGTMVKVTTVKTGRSVVVRINDRGPFSKNRIIDLSEAAARAIGMIDAGSARVTLEVIER
ncbi:MAG TPA: septal ring lytic transglycosylase RlpA family protein [Kofleriaceae bacterium]|jgi:rare lipoprotein A